MQTTSPPLFISLHLRALSHSLSIDLELGLSRSLKGQRMNWISRKAHLYNVTMGLYILDWWERFLFNMLILVLLWFITYNGSRSATQFYSSHLKPKVLVGGNFTIGGVMGGC